MGTATFREFEADAKAQGFDEVLERRWAPLAVLDVHSHPFDVKALVVGGEMWLTAADATRHLQAGDAFELGADAPHAERYGSRGATYWVARRHRGDGGPAIARAADDARAPQQGAKR